MTREPYTSVAIGDDGNPVISYWEGTSDDLKVVILPSDSVGVPG